MHQRETRSRAGFSFDILDVRQAVEALQSIAELAGCAIILMEGLIYPADG